MKKSRVFILFLMLSVMFGFFVLRLVRLQLMDGESYRLQSLARVVTKQTEESARGEILDRYCRPLVRNETVLCVDLNLTLCKGVNETLCSMIEIFRSYGQSYNDSLPISAAEPYIYTVQTMPNDLRNFLTARKVDPSSTAEEVISALIRYYNLEEYPPDLARAIIGVRFTMYRSGSPTVYSFATDVSIDVISALRERSESLVGVEISSDYNRVYAEEYFASHILGYVGPISAAEYEVRKSQGYSLTDTLGKDGIEKICEDYLRGKDGYRYIEVNTAGAITSQLSGQSAVFGSDVILTIDKNMQEITEDSLAASVAANRENLGEGSATSAAAVFIDVKTGEILSLASFPDYNLSTFYQDYAELSKSEESPYMNRAISGAFPPGSTWKVVTAIAGLEEGVITEKTTYRCTGTYTFYDTYQPTCSNTKAHGVVNVESALAKSCNCFFYDVGRQLGSDKLAEYAHKFGFGARSGIELAGESAGTVASKSRRESLGQLWQSGETLLAAIGQTDNAVTPLQLACLAATVANDGVRMQPRLIRSIINRDTGETIEYRPTVAETVSISSKTLSLVKSGMFKVVNDSTGTASRPFVDYDIVQVAGKSGTAETPPGYAAALFIGYAPADNPKIAFAVVIEHAGRAAQPYTAQVVKDVLSYYFSHQDSFDSIRDNNSLLP